jgi:hypothetical protein
VPAPTGGRARAFLGLFWSRPELPDQPLAAGPDEPAKDERDHDRVVELSCDWDRVGNEVKRQCQVAGEREQEELAATGDARVAGEPQGLRSPRSG